MSAFLYQWARTETVQASHNQPFLLIRVKLKTHPLALANHANKDQRAVYSRPIARCSLATATEWSNSAWAKFAFARTSEARASNCSRTIAFWFCTRKTVVS